MASFYLCFLAWPGLLPYNHWCTAMTHVMKQTIKAILSSTFHLLVFGGVIFAVSALRPDSPTTPAGPTTEATNQEAAAARQQAPAVQLTGAASGPAKSPAPSAPSPAYAAIKTAVQHEYEYRMFATANDPGYAGNWALGKVNAPAAWDKATGNGSTVVAVIDSGVALGHEDLASQWLTNAGETGTTQPGDNCWTGTPQPKQSNNCDDDGNGYTDDWRGWNFVLNDNNPQTGRQNPSGDGVRHGTQVAGYVGAAGNNGIGMTTVNWNTKMMPLQALSDNGIGYTSAITAAVYYAVDNGAHAINLSLGAYANDPAMRAAVAYAAAHGVVVVAASGNCGDGSGEECSSVPAGTVAYPAAYPEVVAVGATTNSDQRASFSSYGQALDVVAPGYALPPSTSWSAGNQTALYSGALYGTSYAAPQVASLAALIKSLRPASSVADITALISGTTTKPNAMGGLVYTPQLGHGIINANSALTITQALTAHSSTPELLQAGSFISEHTAPAGATMSSGCQLTGGACTVQLTGDNGHTRYLPYALVSSGSSGWTWSSDMLEGGGWQIRARSGDNVSATPYYLFKKG